VASFRVSGTHTSANFTLTNDGSGYLLVSYVDPPAPAPRGGAAELIGRYGSALAEPLSMPTSDARAFDAWTTLGSNAGTHSGVFDLHYDGNAGRARDALGVGVGSEGYIGHGPGPGS
jgi:hypothetical protein